MKIPFTADRFFQIIEQYNLTLFPAQLLILIAGAASVWLIQSQARMKNELTGGFLALLWLWIGIMYHLAFFTIINPAAYIFGGFFVVQGILFLYESVVRKRLEFEFKWQFPDFVACFFILFGLVIYPVLSYFMDNSLNTTIALGLPCPSTIFTFGILMLAGRKFPKYLLIIPAAWVLIGTTAAFKLGVYPDYMMPVAALTAILYLSLRKIEDRKTV